MPRYAWNEAETEQLTSLFHEGFSFSQIAKALGTKSKNGCVSKSKRIGLAPRIRVIACERAEPVKHSPRPRIRQEQTPAPVPAVDSKDWRCTIIQLTDRSCRYPLWEMPEDEHLYCGKPTARLSEGKPYCATHAKLTFHTRA